MRTQDLHKQVRRRVQKFSDSFAQQSTTRPSQEAHHHENTNIIESNGFHTQNFSAAQAFNPPTTSGVEIVSPQLEHTPASVDAQSWSQFLDGSYENASFFDLDSFVSGGQYFGWMDG